MRPSIRAVSLKDSLWPICEPAYLARLRSRARSSRYRNSRGVYSWTVNSERLRRFTLNGGRPRSDRDPGSEIRDQRLETLVGRIACNRACHAMPSAPSAPKFRASYRNHLDARLSQQCVRVGIAVVADD